MDYMFLTIQMVCSNMLSFEIFECLVIMTISNFKSTSKFDLQFWSCRVGLNLP